MKILNFLTPGLTLVAVLGGIYSCIKLLESDQELNTGLYLISLGLLVVNSSFLMRYFKKSKDQ